MSNVVKRLEKGDLKLRVRTLESERAFERTALVQSTQGKLILASAVLNAGIAMSMSNAPLLASRLAFGVAGLIAAQFPLGLLKLKKFDKKSQTYGF
mmetsp:Transcript_30654/g.53800  ORF Transcript_30654/g.53800 Transcript_30654/m.53800 type:complete len:96 (+) Transcript_30654:1262-1549(+)